MGQVTETIMGRKTKYGGTACTHMLSYTLQRVNPHLTSTQIDSITLRQDKFT